MCADGFGYIRGVVKDQALYRGSYITVPLEGERFTIVDTNGEVSGDGTLISGIILNQGLMTAGCKANNVSVGSVIREAGGCGGGALLYGEARIYSGFMVNQTLNNQYFNNGEIGSLWGF